MQTRSNTLEEFSPVALAQTSEDEYCRAALRMHHNEFWWYLNGLAPYRGYSMPFQERGGRWWYRVKPGFAWPVDYFSPRIGRGGSRSPGPRLLGWQFPVADEIANSQVWMNVIHDLSGYGIGAVGSSKRRAIRKGLSSLVIEAVNPDDPALAEEAREVWNSHVDRTSWNRRMEIEPFRRTWSELAAWPGTTVLFARAVDGGAHLCAWLVARVIDSTAYVDTIASHTDRVDKRPNDALIFVCLSSGALAGVRRAHYSLKSNIQSLEEFKQSLGFVAHGFPSYLLLRWPVGPVLRILRPAIYKRLHGDLEWSENSEARHGESGAKAER